MNAMIKKILISPYLYVMGIVALAVVAYFMDIREFVGKYPLEVGILSAIFLVGSMAIVASVFQSIKKAMAQEMKIQADDIRAKLDESNRDRERYKTAYLNLCEADKKARMERAVYMINQEENE